MWASVSFTSPSPQHCVCTRGAGGGPVRPLTSSFLPAASASSDCRPARAPKSSRPPVSLQMGQLSLQEGVTQALGTDLGLNPWFHPFSRTLCLPLNEVPNVLSVHLARMSPSPETQLWLSR